MASMLLKKLFPLQRFSPKIPSIGGRAFCVSSPGSLRTEDEEKAMFEAWAIKYGKSYDTIEEKEKRFQIFRDTLKFIDTSKTAGLNLYSDQTLEELRVEFPAGCGRLIIVD